MRFFMFNVIKKALKSSAGNEKNLCIREGVQ